MWSALLGAALGSEDPKNINGKFGQRKSQTLMETLMENSNTFRVCSAFQEIFDSYLCLTVPGSCLGTFLGGSIWDGILENSF